MLALLFAPGGCNASDKLISRSDNCAAAAARGYARAVAASLLSICTRISARARGTGTSALGAAVMAATVPATRTTVFGATAIAATDATTPGPAELAAASAAPQNRECPLAAAAGSASLHCWTLRSAHCLTPLRAPHIDLFCRKAQVARRGLCCTRSSILQLFCKRTERGQRVRHIAAPRPQVAARPSHRASTNGARNEGCTQRGEDARRRKAPAPRRPRARARSPCGRQLYDTAAGCALHRRVRSGSMHGCRGPRADAHAAAARTAQREE